MIDRNMCRAIYLGALVLAIAMFGCGKKPTPTAEIERSQPREGVDSPPGETQSVREDRFAWKGNVKDVFFEYDRAELRSDARAILQENGRILKENPDARITLEGHCDERGTEEYNLALGQRRAEAVKVFLTDLGIDASRFSVVSYGEEKPFAAGHGETDWSQNRRVHFVLP